MRNRKIFYKYRGLEPWEFLLDIFISNRLYAASFKSLNDPMEGVFTYSQDKIHPSFIEQMKMHKSQLRICSLSNTHNNTVMWSYYAAGHEGLVIGFEIDNSNNTVEINKVTYAKNNTFRGFLGSDAETEAKKVLIKKLSAWKHEQEIRVFSKSEFVYIKIKNVYLGCQMLIEKKNLIRNLLVRLDPNIKIYEMQRSDLDSNIDE